MITQGFTWVPSMVQVHDRDTHVGVTAHRAGTCRRDLPTALQSHQHSQPAGAHLPFLPGLWNVRARMQLHPLEIRAEISSAQRAKPSLLCSVTGTAPWCLGAELSPGAAPVAPVWHPRVAVGPCVPLDPLRSRSRSTRPGLALLLGPLNRALQPLPKSSGSHRCPCPTFKGTAPSGYFGLSTCLLSPATAALCQGLGWEGCR